MLLAKRIRIDTESKQFSKWLQALGIIDSLVLPGTDKLDVRDKAAVARRIRGAVSAKQFGLEDVLCPLIAEVRPAAAWHTDMPRRSLFDRTQLLHCPQQ